MRVALALLAGVLLVIALTFTHPQTSKAQGQYANGLLPPVPVPIDNPMTDAKINLGKQLYFEGRLSSDGTISCASCHRPDKAWADTEPVSEGVAHQKGSRNSPSASLLPGQTNYGAAITPEILQASDAEFSKIMGMLREIRAEVSKNEDVLDFADIAPRMTRMMIRKYAFFYQADVLMKEAAKLKQDDPAGARSRIGQALKLLRESDAEVMYLKNRFEYAAKQIGASPLDVKRMGNVHADIELKIKEAKAGLR